MADCLGQGQGAQEAGGVVGQGMQLQPHRVRGEAVAGQAHSSGKYGLKLKTGGLGFGRTQARPKHGPPHAFLARALATGLRINRIATRAA